MSYAVASLPGSRTNRGVFSAAAAVTISASAVKLAAVVKEFVVAGVYARSDALEAFLVAALIPGLLVNLVSESMNQALVPTLVRVKEFEGRGRAQRLLSNALVGSGVLLVITSIAISCLGTFLFPLIGSHFSNAKVNLAIHLFYGLTPIIVLTGVASTCAAVLNTEGYFALPTIAPAATSVAIVVAVPAFSRYCGIWALAYATVIGALIHVIWIGWATNRRGYRISLQWHGFDEATREVSRQCWPVMLSSVVASGGLIVDQSMAAMLPAGSVSALTYAGRFVSVALTLLGGSVASAVTPFFSEMVVHSDWNGCRKALRIWSSWSLVVAALAAGSLALGARFLVRVTFQHGQFGAQDTSVVAFVLKMYALQIPFFVCSRVFYRFLIAMRRTDLVFYCGLINLVVDIVLNLLLMRWMGVAGIALSTSVWSAGTLVFLGYWTWRVLPAERRDPLNSRG